MILKSIQESIPYSLYFQIYVTEYISHYYFILIGVEVKWISSSPFTFPHCLRNKAHLLLSPYSSKQINPLLIKFLVNINLSTIAKFTIPSQTKATEKNTKHVEEV